MEQETLATELLHEVKAQSRRWFTAFLIVLVLWFATIGAFLWYISLPIEEYDTYVEQEATERSFNIVGGNYNGSETESPQGIQETSNP